MLNKSAEKAKALVKQYPKVFGNIDIASQYLFMLDNLKDLDEELKKIGGKGKELSETLINFLKTKNQLKSPENLFNTLIDVSRFCQICSTFKDQNIKKYANNVLKVTDSISAHLLDNLFHGFDYTNLAALKELNLKNIKEIEKRHESNENSNKPTSGKQ